MLNLFSVCEEVSLTTSSDISIAKVTDQMPIEIPKITMCVLGGIDGMSQQMHRSDHPAFAQINVVNCQIHEVCTPESIDVNIGKFGLGYILWLL